MDNTARIINMMTNMMMGCSHGGIPFARSSWEKFGADAVTLKKYRNTTSSNLINKSVALNSFVDLATHFLSPSSLLLLYSSLEHFCCHTLYTMNFRSNLGCDRELVFTSYMWTQIIQLMVRFGWLGWFVVYRPTREF